MDKFKRYDIIVSCLFETILEQGEKDGLIQLSGLELSHKADKCILEVANMVQGVAFKEFPVYLEMSWFTFWKNKLLRRFKKFNVKRTKRFLPTSNMRGSIIYRTSLKYCSRILNEKWAKEDRNFLIYSQIEDYLDEIYDEYYKLTKKR